MRNVSDDQFYTAAGNSSRKIQMGIAGWGADFPTASNFFRPVLSCRSFNQNPASTGNLAEFCDPHADELADQAQAAQQTDPAAARKLWASIDRIVTDQAPWVPVLTDVSNRVRLRPGRELPGIPVLLRPAARPDLGPIAASGLIPLVLASRPCGGALGGSAAWACRVRHLATERVPGRIELIAVRWRLAYQPVVYLGWLLTP